MSRRELVEYNNTYKTFIPRAPAFRVFSAAKIKEIIERLSDKQKVSQKQRAPAPVMYRQLSFVEVQDLNARVNQPTMSSKLRAEIQGRKTPITQINLSCERCRKPPSVRFFPGCYRSFTTMY
ncbi:hypothetical protein FSP39_014745 [Pinctada imbricata]|uniref:Uncharacterized protein n=1 Tax=Pinctada imbricata TaxID=66713 RepID=A0AA89BR99_PINIB|nr:hypothetical protein FSP39_014745 [Pinctada imbricata]